MKRLEKNDLLNLEILIADLAESADIKTASELERFSDEIHCHIENAFLDYAYDLSIDDYESQY